MATPTSVEALAPGDHACLTFSDPDERLDILAAFVHDGLCRGHKVMAFTESIAPERLTAELTDRGVPVAQRRAAGQLALFSSDESWLAEGEPTASGMIDLLARHIDRASREGYAGLRVTADMCWATRPIAGAEQLPIFEAEVGALFADGRLTAICQYDRQSFDAVTLSFATASHSCLVAATVYHEDPVLRICRQHSPPGIRLAGEIDYTHADKLALALGEAARLNDEFQVNLAKLRFMDAATATTIARGALALPPGRVMTIVCGGAVHRMLRLVGAGEVPALRMTKAHGEP
jgi:hypothetical protein